MPPADNCIAWAAMTPRLKTIPLLLALGVTLAGCATKPVHENEYNDPRYTGPGSNMPGADQGLILFGGPSKPSQDDSGGAGLGVNAYLWRATLDTLSFMPLASADPFGGVIITDWFQPPAAPGERFKVTAYILGRQLRTDALRVSVFRQTQQGGQWVDAQVSPSTPTELENKVLARARELRSQAAGN
jgi:hypothetical protein